LDWHCLFVSPFWLETTVRHLGENQNSLILAAMHADQYLGIVPLKVNGAQACFLGDPNVCDYQDIICAPGAALETMRQVVDHLRQAGVESMDLGTLRPDAKALVALNQLAEEGCVRITVTAEETTFEASLPATWDLFLQQLNGKQRHEVRRKIRRLETAGPVAYAEANNGNLAAFTDVFITLFRSNRSDKAVFMSDVMEGYFRSLIQVLENQGMLRLYVLSINRQPAAAVLCFDYQGVRYLYNSGYDVNYQNLSVGVLSKVFSIQKAIETGCRTYDFLKGAETYKKRIGGYEVPLYRCRVAL
jgi:CelD/BcsL family acetyltransferase involved in cellulose biosynthesis